MTSPSTASPISLSDSISPSSSPTGTILSSSRSSPANDLPIELLLQIARYTLPQESEYAFMSVTQRNQLWCSTNHALLGYCLVQKSWKPILEILYSIIEPRNRISQPKLLSYALRKQPEVRRCLTQFAPAWFRHPSTALPTEWEYYINPDTEMNNAWATILQLSAASITHIDMPYELLYPLRYPLSQLRGAETCTLNQWYDYEDMRTAGTDVFSVLFPAIRDWTRLSRLSIRIKWGKWDVGAGNPVSESSQRLAHRPPTFSLHTLSLSYGSYTGSQLLHLLSSSTRTLQRLSIEGISGLSEADLYDILSGPCLLLKTLKVERCSVTLSPQLSIDHNLSTGNPKPIDIAISRMVNLTSVLIDDSLVTPSVIAAKPTSTSAPAASSSPYITIRPTSGGGTDWSAEDVLNALQTTGWKTIMFNADFYPDDDVVNMAQAVADERGVKISFFSPYLLD